MSLFEQSLRMTEEIYQKLDNSYFLEGGPRLDFVYQCCDISMQHSSAVKILLENKLYTSALAIFRIQFESVVRSYWLLMKASNDQILKIQRSSVADFFKNEKLPMVSEMITQLKTIDKIKHVTEHFEGFKFYSLQHLNPIVHTGRHSFMRDHLGLDSNQYTALMQQSNGLFMMAAQIMLRHCEEEPFMKIVTEKYRSCFLLKEDIPLEELERIHSLYEKNQKSSAP